MFESFSYVLKSFVEAKGTNILQASEKIGVSRQKFYRFMEGIAFPSEEEFNELCRVIRPSINEKSRLINAYNMTKVGPIVYETRLCVESLITKVSNANSELSAAIRVPDKPAQQSDLVLLNKLEVGAAVADMFRFDDCDSLTIYILAQPDSDVLVESLKYVLKQSTVKTTVHHGVRLSTSVGAVENVGNFAKVVPLLFIRNDNVRYSFKYHYASELSNNKFSEIYPNIIIRNQRALLLSSEMSTGIVLNSSEQVELLTNDVDNVMHRMEPISHFHDSLDNLCDFYAQLTEVDFKEAYYFEQQPCVEFLNPERYRRYIEENQPLVYELMVKRYNSFIKHLNDRASYHQLFTRRGIDLLLKDHLHLDIPRGVFDEAAMAKLMPEFLEEITELATHNDNFSLYMAPNDFLDINLSGCVVVVLSGYCVTITDNPLLEYNRSPILVIREEGVVNAFAEYFSSLIDKNKIQDEKTYISNTSGALEYIKQRLADDNK